MRGGAARRISMVIGGALVSVTLLGGTAAAQEAVPSPEGIGVGFGDAVGPTQSGGPSGFFAFAVLVMITGVGVTVWKVLAAREMAREAGLDPDRATAVTLLDEDGFAATYLASSLRDRPGDAGPSDASEGTRRAGADAPADPSTSRSSPDPAATASPSIADRLRALDQLRDVGLVTAEEHTARRAKILDEL